jgi:hypothetical protein
MTYKYNTFLNKLDFYKKPGQYNPLVYWDDLRVPIIASAQPGSSPPHFSQFRNDESVSTDNGLYFNGNGASANIYSVLADVVEDLNANFTIECWIKPTRVANEYICWLGNNCRIALFSSGGQSVLYHDFGSATTETNVQFNVDAWNHLICSVDKPNEIIHIWLNGNYTQGDIGTGAISASNIHIGYSGSPAGFNLIGTLDYMTIYDTLFTNTQALARYNNGQGNVILPTGITDSNRILYLDFEEGSGSILTNTKGDNLTINGTETTDFLWTLGAIGATGYPGVYTWHFAPDQSNEMHFSLQLPHTYKEGTNIFPHVHWCKTTSNEGNVKWGIEYTIKNYNDVFGGTSILEATTISVGDDNTPYEHLITNLGEITGTGLKISAMLMGRVYRLGTDTEDTYPDDAALLEIDIHYQLDAAGSTQIYTK